MSPHTLKGQDAMLCGNVVRTSYKRCFRLLGNVEFYMQQNVLSLYLTWVMPVFYVSEVNMKKINMNNDYVEHWLNSEWINSNKPDT